jgi:hypothetical protein
VKTECGQSTTTEESGPGDTFLMLNYFPVGLVEEELPWRVGPGVYLDSIPRGLLDATDPRAWADFVLPGYNVQPADFRYCLRSPSGEAAALGQEPVPLFFNSVGALRLQRPFHITVEGWMRVEGGGAMKLERGYHLASPWKPEFGGFYLHDDLDTAAAIAKRQLEVWELANRRIRSATGYFLQVTCGFSISFQLAYLGLFAALEALLSAGKADARALSERTARFLSKMPPPQGWEIQKWVYSEYKDVRNKLSHGDQDINPWRKKLSCENRQRLGRLHEIARLCILGFMGLSDRALLEIGKAKKQVELERLLDQLEPASGGFMTDQHMWCD